MILAAYEKSFLNVYKLFFTQPNELIIPTTETVRQRYFLELFLSHEKPLLLVGPTGTGKSAITNNYILRMPSDKYVYQLELGCLLSYPYVPCWMLALVLCHFVPAFVSIVDSCFSNSTFSGTSLIL